MKFENGPLVIMGALLLCKQKEADRNRHGPLVLDPQNRSVWCLWCSGFCMAVCEAEGGGSIPLRHP